MGFRTHDFGDPGPISAFAALLLREVFVDPYYGSYIGKCSLARMNFVLFNLATHDFLLSQVTWTLIPRTFPFNIGRRRPATSAD